MRTIARLAVALALGTCSAAFAQPTPAATTPPPPPVPYMGKADLNYDLALDIQDFRLFLQCWKAFHDTATLTAAADFNKNGAIDAPDAAFFLSEWLLADHSAVRGMRDLGTLGGDSSSAADINAAGLWSAGVLAVHAALSQRGEQAGSVAVTASGAGGPPAQLGPSAADVAAAALWLGGQPQAGVSAVPGRGAGVAASYAPAPRERCAAGSGGLAEPLQ